MEELNSQNQKGSGLLAKIQAMQAQQEAENAAASDETITVSTSLPDDQLASPDVFTSTAISDSFDDTQIEESIYPDPEIPDSAFAEDLFKTNPFADSSDTVTSGTDLDFNDDFDPTTTGTDLDSNPFAAPSDSITTGTDLDLEFDSDFAPTTTGTDLDSDTSSSFDDSDPFENANPFVNPEPMAASGGLSFTGLYDKETIMGDSSDQSDQIKKKTKVPVIICVVCAIICLIATTLILFIIPSKYNLITKKTVKVDENTVIIETESSNPRDKSNINQNTENIKLAEQSNVPPAKENQIVIVENAEDVIPLPPVVNKQTTKDVQYKIKWGDTLWDISNTYYKTPWKYKNIAAYNKISNPDHIISGTTITIPAE